MGHRTRLIALTLTAMVYGCSEARYVLPPAPDLPPQVRVENTDHWYAVTGRTVSGITQSLQRDIPQWGDMHAWALTTWRVAWTGRSTEHQGTCRMVDVAVSVQVEMLLPRWVDRQHATERARERWDEFEQAVVAHERGHRNIAYMAAVALLDHVETAQASSCVTLAEELRTSARLLLEGFRQADQEYDRRTHRGARHGVVW